MENDGQTHDIAKIRELLNATFDDVGLIALCQDEFPKLCDSLARGLRKDEIIIVILDHFRRSGDFSPLLDAVKARRPDQYVRFFNSSLLEPDEREPIDAVQPPGEQVPQPELGKPESLWSRVREALGSPVWQGISAIVGILACIVAVLAIMPIQGIVWPSILTSTATPTIPAGRNPGDTWIRPTDTATMVWVPGGTFLMGSDRTQDPDADPDDEAPVHSVTLDGFWIDQTPVTNKQFAAFLNEKGNQKVNYVSWLDETSEDCLIIKLSDDTYGPKSGYAEHPVICVSWHGAEAYCEWIGGRLPTEAEWEYAARGKSGSTYPWGNTFDCSMGYFGSHLAGCNDDYGSIAPVGRFSSGASWCKALDMAGNVWEWVADWYDKYPSEKQVNPEGPTSSPERARVLRGGCWNRGYDRTNQRAANRFKMAPDWRLVYVGFRCVVSPGSGD